MLKTSASTARTMCRCSFGALAVSVPMTLAGVVMICWPYSNSATEVWRGAPALCGAGLVVTLIADVVLRWQDADMEEGIDVMCLMILLLLAFSLLVTGSGLDRIQQRDRTTQPVAVTLSACSEHDQVDQSPTYTCMYSWNVNGKAGGDRRSADRLYADGTQVWMWADPATGEVVRHDPSQIVLRLTAGALSGLVALAGMVWMLALLVEEIVDNLRAYAAARRRALAVPAAPQDAVPQDEAP
jgi:hypothetical protein